MNWDRIEGNWKQFKGTAKQQWGKLTDDQLDVIAGKRDHLVGKIQEAYGITKEVTEKQVADWLGHQKETEHIKPAMPSNGPIPAVKTGYMSSETTPVVAPVATPVATAKVEPAKHDLPNTASTHSGSAKAEHPATSHNK